MWCCGTKIRTGLGWRHFFVSRADRSELKLPCSINPDVTSSLPLNAAGMGGCRMLRCECVSSPPQLLQDLKTLRSLLDYVFRYDAITFYQLLLAEKSKAAAVRDPPLWIGTAGAER